MAILTLAVGGLATILGLLVSIAPNLDMAIQASAGVTTLAIGMSVMAIALSKASTGIMALGEGGWVAGKGIIAIGTKNPGVSKKIKL